MSSPPFPGVDIVDKGDSGTTDANGNATIETIVRSSFWSVVYATCQCQGNGSWALGSNNSPKLFEQGANVVMGPLFLAPNAQASLQVVGATAKTGVSVSYWGFQAAAPGDLVGLLSSVATTGSLAAITGPVTIGGGNVGISGNVPVLNAPGTQLDTRQEQTLLLSGVTVARDGAAHSLGILSLPIATHALMVAAQDFPSAISIPGQTSTIDWGGPLPGLVGNAFPVYTYKVAQAIDPTVGLNITFPNLGGTTKVWVAAILDTLLDIVDSTQSGLTSLGGFDTSSPAIFRTGVMEIGIGGRWRTGVSLANSSPAPWQAANQLPFKLSLNLAAGASQTLLTPPAGQQIYLHAINWLFAGTTAGCFGAFSVAGTDICSWNLGLSGPFSFNNHGAPLGINQSLVVKNNSTTNMGPFFDGQILYSFG